MIQIHLHDNPRPNVSWQQSSSRIKLIADIIDGDIIDEKVGIVIEAISKANETEYIGSVANDILVGPDRTKIIPVGHRLIFEPRHVHAFQQVEYTVNMDRLLRETPTLSAEVVRRMMEYSRSASTESAIATGTSSTIQWYRETEESTDPDLGRRIEEIRQARDSVERRIEEFVRRRRDR